MSTKTFSLIVSGKCIFESDKEWNNNNKLLLGNILINLRTFIECLKDQRVSGAIYQLLTECVLYAALGFILEKNLKRYVLSQELWNSILSILT